MLANQVLAPVLSSASPSVSPAPITKKTPQLTPFRSFQSTISSMESRATAPMATTALLRRVAGSCSQFSIVEPAIQSTTEPIRTIRISRSGALKPPDRSNSCRAGSVSMITAGTGMARKSRNQLSGKRMITSGKPYFIQSKKPKPPIMLWSSSPLAIAFSPLPMIVAIAPMLEL